MISNEDIKKILVLGIDLNLRYIAATSTYKEYFEVFKSLISEIYDIKQKLREESDSYKKELLEEKLLRKREYLIKWIERIAHQIIEEAYTHGKGNDEIIIAFEDPSKLLTLELHEEIKESWKFLIKKIKELASKYNNIRIEFVNPLYTSQTCICCGSRDTIREGDYFKCRRCGYDGNVDDIAAKNIALKFVVKDKKDRKKRLEKVRYKIAGLNEEYLEYAKRILTNC